jgi:glutamine---fructose-6-phosphate transaminase (isomerizing)
VSAPSTILESEIRQQPQVLAQLLTDSHLRQVAAAVRAANPRYVAIAARGSSDNAARYAQYLFGVLLGWPVALATPSVTTLYGQQMAYRDALVIGISQSGRSADVGQVVSEAKAAGALTINITNDPSSPMAVEADYHIDLNAGKELSLAASKTYTAQLMALARLVALINGETALVEQLVALPDSVEKTLDLLPMVMQRAERFRFMTRCVVLGRGYNYATAYEIALKLKELTYVVAEPYSSADFRHGPKAMVEEAFPVIAVAPSGQTYPDMLALLGELAARKADLTIIADSAEVLAAAHLPLALPAGIPEWLSPIVAALPGQMLALAVAAQKGHAVDTPRSLNKVTITR